jgi:hypothetical protein
MARRRKKETAPRLCASCSFGTAKIRSHLQSVARSKAVCGIEEGFECDCLARGALAGTEEHIDFGFAGQPGFGAEDDGGITAKCSRMFYKGQTEVMYQFEINLRPARC